MASTAGAASCDLSYLPIGTATFEITAPNNEKARFTTTSVLTKDGAAGKADIGISYKWYCAGQQLRSEIKINANTIKITDGVYLPAADLWKVGYIWKNKGVGIDSKGKVVVTVLSTNKVSKIEKLALPIGMVNAYKVDAQATTEEGVSYMTFWYVKGYGMVKQIDKNSSAVTIMTKFVK